MKSPGDLIHTRREILKCEFFIRREKSAVQPSPQYVFANIFTNMYPHVPNFLRA